MLNYSLNKLISQLSKEIREMDMPGFDCICDYFWEGQGEFDFVFTEGTIYVGCTIRKSFNLDDELDSRSVVIDNIYAITDIHKEPLLREDILTIEESLKL